jgi:putative transposase
MKKTRFPEEQMVKILREADKAPVAKVAKKRAPPRKATVARTMVGILNIGAGLRDGRAEFHSAAARRKAVTRRVHIRSNSLCAELSVSSIRYRNLS